MHKRRVKSKYNRIKAGYNRAADKMLRAIARREAQGLPPNTYWQRGRSRRTPHRRDV